MSIRDEYAIYTYCDVAASYTYFTLTIGVILPSLILVFKFN